jgi:DnaJ domain
MTRAEALRIFELDDHCTQEQVRAAYRELVKVWHPDRFVNDADLRAKADRRLRQINVAYAVLQDRAEPFETPREATRPPHLSTPPSQTHSERTRWSRARLVTIGGLTTATLIGMVTMLVRSQPTAEPPERTGDATPEVRVDDAAPRTPAAFRPLSGTDLLAVAVARGGSLIVLNTDRRDAVLVFVRAGVQTRAVYIRAGERLQMLDVEPGTYRIWIAGGRTWSHDHFATDQMFQELDEPLTFAKDDAAPQTIVIAAPGTDTRTLLRVRSPFPLNLRTE